MTLSKKAIHSGHLGKLEPTPIKLIFHSQDFFATSKYRNVFIIYKFSANWFSFEVYRLFRVCHREIIKYSCTRSPRTSWTHFSFCHGELVHHQFRLSPVQLCAKNVLSSRWYIRRGISQMMMNTSKIPNCHSPQIPGDSAWLSRSTCNQLVS